MKRIFTIAAALLMTASVWAQAPEKMSYQAVVRDAGNALVTSTAVGMQISILQGGATGTAVYVETQTPTTNANGLVSLEIGSGTVVSGDFTTIDWANDTYFIKTETDPTGGATYTITGTTQLMSVPYALHAKTAETITGGITETDPTFTAWDKSTGISITESQISDLTHTVDTDTQLDEAAVDGFVANNGYLTTEVDGSVTNEIELPVGGTNGQVLETDGSGNYTWVNQTVDTDTDTQLDEAAVDGFVANNGYLTTEVDGSVTNEIQNLTDVLSEGNDAGTNDIVNVGTIGIGTSTPNSGAALDINSTTGALLLPRLTNTQQNALSASKGMIIFNTDNNKFRGYKEGEAIDQSLNTGNTAGSFSDGIGQSFTPSSNGDLIAVEIAPAFGSGFPTLNIYAGDGMTGTLLHSQTITFNTSTSKFVLSAPISVVAGQTYTFEIATIAGGWYAPAAPYSGGQGYLNGVASGFDWLFKTYMDDSGWVDLH